MKQIILRLDNEGKIPQELLREIRDSSQEIELIFDAEQYDELFPIMHKLFDEVSMERIKKTKQAHEKQSEEVKKTIKLIGSKNLKKKEIIKKQEGLSQDRRQLPRWQIGKEARISLEDSGEFGYCHIEDMNLKGMCLSLPEEIKIDGPVHMTIAFPDNLDFEVEAEIPWARQGKEEYLYGLSFSRIKDTDKDRIFKYINSTCAPQFKARWGA